MPRYFTQENEKDIRDRMKLMAETLAKYRLDDTSDKKEEVKMSLDEAIKIIQVKLNLGIAMISLKLAVYLLLFVAAKY